MLFSVVIPMFNKADVIVRAIKSVARQTFLDYELIVVDDGSSDSSAECVLAFAQSELWRRTGAKLQLIRQENLGVSAARNRGAIESTGRYVAFLDGDDLWMPGHLSDLSEILKVYPDARVISTQEATVRNGIIYDPSTAERGIGQFDVFDYPTGGYPLHSSTIAIRRDYFMSVGGYNVAHSFYEDRELYYKMAEDVGLFYVNWKTSAFYLDDAAVTANKCNVRPYTEYGHLVYAEDRLSSGRASDRMRRCVVRTVIPLLPRIIVRRRWKEMQEFVQRFPHIVSCVPVFRIVRFGPVVYNFLWLYYGFVSLRNRIRTKTSKSCVKSPVDLSKYK